MKCERWVFGAEGDGEHLRDVDGTDDEVENTLKVVKDVEKVGVLLGLCGASASGKLASVSSEGAGRGRGVGGQRVVAIISEETEGFFPFYPISFLVYFFLKKSHKKNDVSAAVNYRDEAL